MQCYLVENELVNKFIYLVLKENTKFLKQNKCQFTRNQKYLLSLN